MNWLWQSGLSALAFGTAYSIVYYSVSLHKIPSIAFNSAVKCIGLVLMVGVVGWELIVGANSKAMKDELRRAATDWKLVAAMSLISLMWFSAEILFYEGQSLAPNPANAAAIWNLAPVPVFLLSVFVYRTRVLPRQWAGLAILTLAVYLINM